MVTTVKREFARRLPTDLVSLVLEFANFANAERKRTCIEEVDRVCVAWEDWIPFEDSYERIHNRLKYLEGCCHMRNIGGYFLKYCLSQGHHNKIGYNDNFQYCGPRADLKLLRS